MNGTTSAIEILMIDDDAQDRFFVQELLESQHELSVRFHEADRFETGLQFMEKNAPDLVLLDLLLPDKKSVDSVRILQGRFPTT